jgi:hypothetical protein
MGIDWFRDLVICISGLVATGVFIFVAVLAYSLYRRVRPILESLKTTSATIEGISSCVGQEVVKPLIEVASLAQGIRQGIDTVAKLFRR